MSTHRRSRSVTLGDFVAAAFEHAGSVTARPHEAGRLASGVVAHWLTHAGRRDLAVRLAECAHDFQAGPAELADSGEARAA